MKIDRARADHGMFMKSLVFSLYEGQEGRGGITIRANMENPEEGESALRDLFGKFENGEDYSPEEIAVAIPAPDTWLPAITGISTLDKRALTDTLSIAINVGTGATGTPSTDQITIASQKAEKIKERIWPS